MYKEKIRPILQDLESKENFVAGGSVVGIVLSTVNSLIEYIANLTLNKKNYEEVQEKIKEILAKAEELKQKSMNAIDQDNEILEELLATYKNRKEKEEEYQNSCKKATEFCMQVVYIANDTLKLADDISKVGNKMLSSDFKICRYYALASVWSAIENVYINVKSIKDENYQKNIEEKCNEILKEAVLQ